MTQTDAVKVLAASISIPDVNVLLLQLARVRLAANEPDQFLSHATPKDALRRQQREAAAQVEPHLAPEHAQRSRSRAVAFQHTLVQDLTDEVQVLHLLVARRSWHVSRQLGNNSRHVCAVHVGLERVPELVAACPAREPARRARRKQPVGVCGNVSHERVALEASSLNLREMYGIAERRAERLLVHLTSSDDVHRLHVLRPLLGGEHAECVVEALRHGDTRWDSRSGGGSPPGTSR
mmetsp:Transcript_13733/g.36509  ORF Transcript_13733/g.36509 Transcript_13733/m.36509 type:complete len:236 (+) Transcript_13733:682-1389(+)